ncbi:serine hydrolase domain-containing protein [Sunxiuqinia sp. A32]|uniref:serine hydrolase domain-containing protein n=1 Tax=Sunxiuqinia sp. A32 TaxID=3461496 RepID=UPI0040459BAB
MKIPAYYELELKGLNNRISNDLSEFDKAEYISSKVNRFIKKWELKGVSVAIIKDEQLVYAQGFGIANDENEPVQPGHLFRVASVSKLITGIAIMYLVEQGKLRLTDKVFGPDAIINDSTFNKVRDKKLYNITIQHLLAHSGGWSQSYGDPAFNSISIAKKVGDPLPATIDTYNEFVASRRLSFPPGSRVSYSNMGYMFLGEVIEKITGKDYESYIRDEILVPNGILDMHIGSSYKDGQYSNEVNYYEQRGSLKVPSFEGRGDYVPKTYGGNPIELLSAAGGWICSSVELARLLVLVDGHPFVRDILSDASIETMTDNTYAKGPLGWRFASGTGIWTRTGSMAGTSAMIKRQNDGLTWIFLSNTSSWKGSKFTTDINYFMNQITSRVSQWPDVDLFNYYPIESLEIAFIQ